MTTQTEFQRILAQDTFVVTPHDPSLPRKLIGVQAINPDGVTIDAVFSLDQLDGGLKNIADDIAADLARQSDWQNMRNKIDQTIGV